MSTQNILESLSDYILAKITVKGQERRNVHYGAKVWNWKNKCEKWVFEKELEMIAGFLSLSKVLIAPERQRQGLHHKGGDLPSGTSKSQLRGRSHRQVLVCSAQQHGIRSWQSLSSCQCWCCDNHHGVMVRAITEAGPAAFCHERSPLLTLLLCDNIWILCMMVQIIFSI